MKRRLALVRAFAHGVRDGFAQPVELSTSTNLDGLDGDHDTLYTTLDRGINLGQFLRAGRRSQAWTAGYPILLVRSAKPGEPS